MNKFLTKDDLRYLISNALIRLIKGNLKTDGKVFREEIVSRFQKRHSESVI